MESITKTTTDADLLYSQQVELRNEVKSFYAEAARNKWQEERFPIGQQITYRQTIFSSDGREGFRQYEPEALTGFKVTVKKEVIIVVPVLENIGPLLDKEVRYSCSDFRTANIGAMEKEAESLWMQYNEIMIAKKAIN